MVLTKCVASSIVGRAGLSVFVFEFEQFRHPFRFTCDSLCHRVHKFSGFNQFFTGDTALGMVSFLENEDQSSMSKRQMLANIDVAMGGRAAEEVIFGKDSVQIPPFR